MAWAVPVQPLAFIQAPEHCRADVPSFFWKTSASTFNLIFHNQPHLQPHLQTQLQLHLTFYFSRYYVSVSPIPDGNAFSLPACVGGGSRVGCGLYAVGAAPHISSVSFQELYGPRGPRSHLGPRSRLQGHHLSPGRTSAPVVRVLLRLAGAGLSMEAGEKSGPRSTFACGTPGSWVLGDQELSPIPGCKDREMLGVGTSLPARNVSGETASTRDDTGALIALVVTLNIKCLSELFTTCRAAALKGPDDFRRVSSHCGVTDCSSSLFLGHEDAGGSPLRDTWVLRNSWLRKHHKQG